VKSEKLPLRMVYHKMLRVYSADFANDGCILSREQAIFTESEDEPYPEYHH
jgi:hypothetical protein